LTLLVAGLLGLSAGAVAQGTDWTRTFTTTPTGAFVMGNPKAAVKLVEQISYTCPHCSHFTIAAADPLRRDYVTSGKTSVEVRHAVRDRLDFTATLLARCGGAGRFFHTSEVIMAAQPEWVAQGAQFEQTQSAKLNGLSVTDSAKMLAQASGLSALMREQGFTDGQINACLADAKQQKLIGEMANQAWKVKKISGTPAFMINGRDLADTFTWAALEPQLRAAQK